MADSDAWCPPVTPPTPPVQPASPYGPITPGIGVERRFVGNVGTLCAHHWRRLMITGLIKNQLTAHFQGLTDDPLFRAVVWSDEAGTEIVIDTEGHWNPAAAGKSPALIIAPLKMDSQRISINDGGGISPEGHPQFTRRWIGGHIVTARHSLHHASEALAGETLVALGRFAPAIRGALSLTDFAAQSVDRPEQPKKGAPGGERGDWMVAVNISWAFDEVWRLEYESVKLRTVDLSVLLGVAAS